MDDHGSLRMVKRTRRAFTRTVASLVLMSIVLFGMGLAIRKVHQNERKIVLIERSRLFFDEQMRFWADKGKQLAAYAPPASPGAYAKWARDVEDYFGHPVTAFVMNGKEIIWPREKPAALQDRIGQYLAAPESGERLPFKTLGSLQVWRKVLQLDKARYNLWFVRDPTAARGWGAVYDADEDWYSYFRTLSGPGGTRSEFAGTISMLQNTYSLPPDESPSYLIGVRAFVGDSLIFESPVIDTTSLSYKMDRKDGRTIQFFAPMRDVGRSTDRFIARFTWIAALCPLLLILPLYGWYRQAQTLIPKEEETQAS